MRVRPALGRSFLAAVVLALGASGCGASSTRLTGVVPGAEMTPAATPYHLYTHCGISELRLGDEFFELPAPLDDGSGNPPPGWGNPYHDGIVTRLSPTEVEFRDPSGRVLRFDLRPGATALRQVCR